MEKLIIVIGGYIGLYPTGGATWDYVQYPMGFKLMGHDVYYIEDTMQYPVYQADGRAWDDATACIGYLKGVMESIGLGDKWAYRDVVSGTSHGMSEKQIRDICSKADLFVNVSCSTYLRDEYLAIPVRVLIDSDPMFTQVQYALELQGEAEATNWNTRHMMENHNYLFTFGENIGAGNCLIPRFDFKWHTTRQPVCLSVWENPVVVPRGAFTTIMNWSGRKKLKYQSEDWGQKDVEFEKFRELPAKAADADFEVVISPPKNHNSSFDREDLQKVGWTILDPQVTVGSAKEYRHFIRSSFGEFSVAKETYVKSNSGWFSCRSACYLAAGKPVITQETEWSKFIPSGTGLLAFTTIDEAIAGITSVLADPGRHAKAAREIAGEYFDSNIVLKKMLEKLN
jgi:hypothetical protein